MIGAYFANRSKASDGSSVNRVVAPTNRRYSAAAMPITRWPQGELRNLLANRIPPRPRSTRPIRRRGLRIEQPMQVNDKIAHLRIVDGHLRLGLPGRVGAGIVRENADDVELVEILELGAVEPAQLAAEYKMKQLLARGDFGHHQVSRRCDSRGLGLLEGLRAHQFGERRMPLAAGRDQHAMDRLRPIVDQRLAVEPG